MQTINDRFREIFKDSGLSQENFAKRINRGRGEVANIIYDKTEPKDGVIKSVCSAFGVQEDWLRYGLEPKTAAKTQEEEITELVGRAFAGDNDFQRAIIRMLCTRSDAELKALEDAFRTVYESLK